MRFDVMGESAVLVDCGSLPLAFGVRDAVAGAELPGILDIVVGDGNVLVSFDPLVANLQVLVPIAWLTPPGGVRRRRPVQVPVRYDGEDLDEVASRAGLSTADVQAVHSGSDYTVGFMGFSPGFAYLVGLDDRLRLPRRDRPRERVPAGSVAIARGYTAVYPQPTPGGWWLIGHTDLRVFDAGRSGAPSIFQPGDRVRFAPR
ncbi:MAG: 5-oxoprolinase subunit B family protein [Mycobacteriales bacterium]